MSSVLTAPHFAVPMTLGWRPHTPLTHRLPCWGGRPMQFTTQGLPPGLRCVSETGIIEGIPTTEGEFCVLVTAKNKAGTDTREWNVTIGDMLAVTPPAGWNTWNVFGGDIHEDLIKQVAESLIEQGLADVGYHYVNLDDLWQGERDADGMIQPDPSKFPSGIKSLADFLHARGLKLGIYSDAAEKTCAGAVGSYGFEEQDAQQYAAWGVDLLKYDYCHAPASRAEAIKRYRTMGNALNRCGRSIIYSICEWGPRKPWLWAASVGGHYWRTTWDIRDTWDHGQFDSLHAGIIQIVDRQVDLAPHAGPGHWNDPDLLVVGIQGRGQASSEQGALGCTNTEYQAQMSLWCLLAAPLIITCDIRNIDEQTREILTNPEVISINQDPLGRQAERRWVDDGTEVWVKPLSGGESAIGLFNRSDTSVSYVLSFSALGIEGVTSLRDLWAGRTVEVHDNHYPVTIPSHAVVLLSCTPEQTL